MSAMLRRALIMMLALVLSLPAPRARANVAGYLGYWTGLATLVFSGGARETAKCVVIWRAGAANGDLTQTLRCASPSYAINATAAVRITAGRVDGSWEERTYSATGKVTGEADSRQMRLSITGANFNASMEVDSAPCRQFIVLTPTKLDIVQISLDLTKC
jgi:hypothetical protein